jgi:hypothetical protein
MNGCLTEVTLNDFLNDAIPTCLTKPTEDDLLKEEYESTTCEKIRNVVGKNIDKIADKVITDFDMLGSSLTKTRSLSICYDLNDEGIFDGAFCKGKRENALNYFKTEFMKKENLEIFDEIFIGCTVYSSDFGKSPLCQTIVKAFEDNNIKIQVQALKAFASRKVLDEKKIDPNRIECHRHPLICKAYCVTYAAICVTYCSLPKNIDWCQHNICRDFNDPRLTFCKKNK